MKNYTLSEVLIILLLVIMVLSVLILPNENEECHNGHLYLIKNPYSPYARTMVPLYDKDGKPQKCN